MDKVIRPGMVPAWSRTGKEILSSLYIHIRTKEEVREGKLDRLLQPVQKMVNLSITGVVGPRSNGDCAGSCGQCTDELLNIQEYAPGWTEDMAKKLHEIWERWHLNDMKSKCIHQEDWDTSEKLLVQTYSQTDRYRYLEQKVKFNDASEDEKRLIAQAVKVWSDALHGRSEVIDEDLVASLVKEEMLEPWKVNEHTAGWVYPSQHPKGLLNKPCPVCGYKYGGTWLYEEVPEEVLLWLQDLPDTDQKPAWV